MLSFKSIASAFILIGISVFSASFVFSSPNVARQGCCSRHGGVCGCKCCDGSALSAKCSPYYPSCSKAGTKPAPVKPASAKPNAPTQAQKKAQTIIGKVVGVSDGDTITVLGPGNTQYKIRLSEIDAPEKSQAFGEKAKQFTSGLVFGKQVTVAIKETDRYGRSVADVFLPDGRNLNHELLRNGFAWWYKQYSKNPALGKLEAEARAAHKGLWADPRSQPPWDFRHRKRPK